MENSFVPFQSSQIESIRRRNLPLWEQKEATYFVTFRTWDSLDRQTLQTFEEQRKLWIKTHPRPWSMSTWEEYNQVFFSLLDRRLDQGSGVCYLGEPRISKIVEDAIRFFDGTRYYLDDFSVMPNHGHSLLKPFEDYPLFAILHSCKSFTGNLINRELDLEGSFWMPESFDRIVRSWNDLLQTRNYIRQNPSKAGLKPEQYRLGCGIGVSAPKL
jgi:REP element-mobilizing transposase RayT